VLLEGLGLAFLHFTYP